MAAMRLGSTSGCWRNASSPALTRARSSCRSPLCICPPRHRLPACFEDGRPCHKCPRRTRRNRVARASRRGAFRNRSAPSIDARPAHRAARPGERRPRRRNLRASCRPVCIQPSSSGWRRGPKPRKRRLSWKKNLFHGVILTVSGQIANGLTEATPGRLPVPVQPLGPPDSHHLDAAVGWLGLGCVAEARAELDLISAAQQKHPAVLEARWTICAREKRWAEALEIAQAELAVAPDDAPAGCIAPMPCAAFRTAGCPRPGRRCCPRRKNFPANRSLRTISRATPARCSNSTSRDTGCGGR